MRNYIEGESQLDLDVTISQKRYKELLEAEKELSALHAGGVDNWEWYSESLREAGLFDDDDDWDEDEDD